METTNPLWENFQACGVVCKLRHFANMNILRLINFIHIYNTV